jgi:hypothetical protein
LAFHVKGRAQIVFENRCLEKYFTKKELHKLGPSENIIRALK